jgi:hypothetical protein
MNEWQPECNFQSENKRAIISQEEGGWIAVATHTHTHTQITPNPPEQQSIKLIKSHLPKILKSN